MSAWPGLCYHLHHTRRRSLFQLCFQKHNGQKCPALRFLPASYETLQSAFSYRKAKDKAAFRREHESQLILYEAAAKAIKDAGITRLPDLAALKAEYRELDKQKARLYEQYGEVKRELKEYGIIKQNVDSILRVTPGKEQAQEL